MKKSLFAAIAAVAMVAQAAERPVPSPALKARLKNGPEVIGIVHWGLNTYTDREWGFGDEDPSMLNPAKFDANQIVDGNFATVFDSGVLDDADTVWTGRVMADPARQYAVYAIDNNGDVAVWRTDKIN